MDDNNQRIFGVYSRIAKMQLNPGAKYGLRIPAAHPYPKKN